MSAVTPDLYRADVRRQDRAVLRQAAGRQQRRQAADAALSGEHFDLYWDLHLGVKGEAIPAASPARSARTSTPSWPIATRPRRSSTTTTWPCASTSTILKKWIDDRLDDIDQRQNTQPEKTFAWYWIKNGEESEYFTHKDVVFECFHNFVAFSQWGNTLYNIMAQAGEGHRRC